MTQCTIQRNVYTLASPTDSMSKSTETANVLTAHNTNTPSRITTTNVNSFDDSLTNLSWLHDINILKRSIPTINLSTSSSSSSNNPGNNTINNKRKEQPLSNTSTTISSSNIGAVYLNDIDDDNELVLNNDDDDDDDDEQWKIYKTNPQAKPVYSYSQLILLAMRQSGHEKMTLQMIYEWVAENFPYFKKMEPTWQNSIRHNLSLNKCFVKVPRTKKEAGGKGGFWKLSSDYERQRSQNKILINHQHDRSINSSPTKRARPSKRSSNNSDNMMKLNNCIKSEVWTDSMLPCIVSKTQLSLQCHSANVDRSSSYVRMPSSFLSPISSPDALTVPPFYHQQQINDFSSVSTPSPSSSPSSMSSVVAKHNFMSTKLDDTDMLLLDSVAFDWDAYLCETPNDIDVQPLLSTKTEQDLFNDFNAALSDLTYSVEAAAAAGGDPNAFDGFDYPSKPSTFTSLFDEDVYQQSLSVKGRGIKRPSWWLTNETLTQTKLPSLETAFDLKLSK
ncbi:unnamed protein product [Rotaria magnacalcarata]|uniref:Fork-head domain-containing protein n=1 Tax=Rotaria magnacalcarata TaxID=392030 RepID=A0A816XLI1_9BILA|nr:unnamed protein product [Rotaria magnacalcarata]CAF4124865.1 unnamed protein product [Rotaria magnacalcarata]